MSGDVRGGKEDGEGEDLSDCDMSLLFSMVM